MNVREAKRSVKRAVESLLHDDGDLLQRNVGERTITGRLALHLAPLFPNHNVDPEYDRHGLDRKTLALPAICCTRGRRTRKVLPDVVVHLRGNDDDNLVAIELKKDSNSEPRFCDRAKLRGMRRQLGYRVCAFIEVTTGNPPHKARVEWL